LSKDVKKKQIQAKVMLGNTIRAPKRMSNDSVKDTIYIKKEINLNLCPYIKITIGLKRHLQNYHYKGHQEDSWDVPRLGTSFLTTLLM